MDEARRVLSGLYAIEPRFAHYFHIEVDKVVNSFTSELVISKPVSSLRYGDRHHDYCCYYHH